jgi:CHASE1-domain containing sensor protein
VDQPQNLPEPSKLSRVTVAFQVARVGLSDRLTRAALVIGVGLSLVGFFVARMRQLDLARAEWREDAEGYARVLRDGFERPAEVAHAAPPLLSVLDPLDADRFQRFAEALLRRHPGLAYVEWAPRVTDAERAAFEREGARTHANFRIREPRGDEMVVAPARPTYFPLLYTYPQDNIANGLDITFEPVRERTVHAVVASHAPGASGKFQLVEDPAGVFSIALYSPVFRTNGELRGLLIQLYRLNPTIERILHVDALGGAGFLLRDVDASRDEDATLFESHAGLARRVREERDAYRERFVFEGRHWEVTFVPAPGRLRTAWIAWAVLLVGLVTTALMVAGRSVQLHVRRLERAVLSARELGQYRLLRKLGAGGMGTVYVAEHAMLRRPTAVKLVTNATPESQARFEREVKLTSQLSHPNTIAIYDYGRTPDGVFYYAMEYLRGVDLGRLAHHHAPLPVARCLHIVHQIAAALAEAHDRGLIHRDVKPANVMLTERGGIKDFVKVLDFGLVEHEAQPRGSSDVGGTAGYMAPEAFTRPEELTNKVDVYAVGVILYELLTGKAPITGGSFLEIATNTLIQTPRAPSDVVPHIPQRVDELVAKCLARHPDDRLTMRELHTSLGTLTKDLPWTQAEASSFWSANASLNPVEGESTDWLAPEQATPTILVDLKRRAG